MIAPPKWSEPFQSPEFDEITFVIRGKKQIEIDDEKIILNENESILVRKGTRVRYSNPFDEPVEYVSVCIPAFSIEKVHREIE
jgi:mannose-6-phosphate isomerase-like protein (cupin superfamily)